jgi:hypothetical protein
VASFIDVLLVDAYCIDPEVSLSMLVSQLAKCVFAIDSDLHRLSASNLYHFRFAVIAFFSRPGVRHRVEFCPAKEDVDDLTSDGIRRFTRQQDNKPYFLAESNMERIVFVLCKVSGRRLRWLESRLPGFEDRFTAGETATKTIEHSNIRVTTCHHVFLSLSSNSVVVVVMKKQLKAKVKCEFEDRGGCARSDMERGTFPTG